MLFAQSDRAGKSTRYWTTTASNLNEETQCEVERGLIYGIGEGLQACPKANELAGRQNDFPGGDKGSNGQCQEQMAEDDDALSGV
jgi:hypothetical protein